MAKQTFTTGSVLTATQMNNLQANDYNWDLNSQTASYVLVAADAGKRVQMNAAGATTITVNTSLFTAGDTVVIQNIGAGTCTVTAGTATVNKATNASLALSQYQGGVLYFVSASSSIFFPFDAGAAAATPTFSGCALYRTSGLTITNTVITQIPFTAEVYDTDNYHSTSTNTSRVTIPTGKGGKYLLTGSVEGSAGNTSASVYVYKNGSASTELPIQRTASVSGYGLAFLYTNVINLVAGDYIEFYFLSAGGSGNPTVWGNNANATDGVFTVTWLGA